MHRDCTPRLNESWQPQRLLQPTGLQRWGLTFPLHLEARAEQVVRARSWPQPVDAVIAQQVNEVARESRTTPDIPVLTSIDDGISSMVRQQYEENPYPRWVKAGPPGQPPIPQSPPRAERPLDVLVAGCGTGLSTTEFARHAHGARILAIDLSLASLSYGKRMAQNLASPISSSPKPTS